MSQEPKRIRYNADILDLRYANRNVHNSSRAGMDVVTDDNDNSREKIIISQHNTKVLDLRHKQPSPVAQTKTVVLLKNKQELPKDEIKPKDKMQRLAESEPSVVRLGVDLEVDTEDKSTILVPSENILDLRKTSPLPSNANGKEKRALSNESNSPKSSVAEKPADQVGGTPENIESLHKVNKAQKENESLRRNKMGLKGDDIDEETLLEVSKKMKKPNYYNNAFKVPIMDHIAELRKRALYCMVALFIGGYFGYRYQDQIIAWLVKPLGQKLFYTSPTGGFDFLIKICLFFGFIVTIPVIIYNVFKFISPAIPPHIGYSFYKIMIMSVLLAIGGASFAYFISLPAALHFLNNFSNEQISSLISAQEYFSFIMIYMAGFALLFQMPLVLSFINKITPLKPAKLLRQQKVVILVSFVIAAILTPTPDPMNQALMAAPIITLYQTSVGVVWRDNKRLPKKSKKVRSRLKYA